MVRLKQREIKLDLIIIPKDGVSETNKVIAPVKLAYQVIND
ncbi:MAG: hypothetical protein ACYTE5_04285 [Planctomycetota bacterium]